MCGEELVKNYNIGWVCPKTYGDSWYHFSISYADDNDSASENKELESVSLILESHQLHVTIDYRKNRTVLTAMSNKGEMRKQIAWIDHSIPLDITDKAAIEQKIRLLATFS